MTKHEEKHDILGNPVEYGVPVVFGLGGTMTLTYGVVIKLNPKTATIEVQTRRRQWGNGEWVYSWGTETFHRTYDNIVVVPSIPVHSEGDGTDQKPRLK